MQMFQSICRHDRHILCRDAIHELLLCHLKGPLFFFQKGTDERRFDFRYISICLAKSQIYSLTFWAVWLLYQDLQ